jgi:hypothetical protein
MSKDKLSNTESELDQTEKVSENKPDLVAPKVKPEVTKTTTIAKVAKETPTVSLKNKIKRLIELDFGRDKEIRIPVGGTVKNVPESVLKTPQFIRQAKNIAVSYTGS